MIVTLESFPTGVYLGISYHGKLFKFGICLYNQKRHSKTEKNTQSDFNRGLQWSDLENLSE